MWEYWGHESKPIQSKNISTVLYAELYAAFSFWLSSWIQEFAGTCEAKGIVDLFTKTYSLLEPSWAACDAWFYILSFCHNTIHLLLL